MSGAAAKAATKPGSPERAGMALPLFHSVAGKPVLVLGEGAAAAAKARLVERAGGVVTNDFARAVDEGVRLAFIAFDDPDASSAAAINARCAGMLVNVVDRPELCDFTTPSIVERAPLVVAVGTGGASAGLAKHVRLQLERLLPASLGDLARALEAARPLLRARWPDPRARREALDGALRDGGALDPFDARSAQRVTEWAAQAGGADERADAGVPAFRGGTIHSFTLASSDPDDLTLRQARLLGEADLLLLDGDVPRAILARARADAERQAWSGGRDSSGQAALEAERCGAALALILRWRPGDRSMITSTKPPPPDA